MKTTIQTAAVFLCMILAMASADPENPHAPPAEPQGTVIATESAGIYTYVQIEHDGEQNWFALPKKSFAAGEVVFVPSDGLPMKDFYSETLDRTFEIVYFVGAIRKVDEPAGETLPPGHPPIEAADKPAEVETDFSDIVRPEGGVTVAEIYEQQDTLAGSSVLVRGRVVKVANNILGKNWIHLRDGSGDADSNDLTVTTQETVALGETVTLRGTLSLDRDFGSGYKYDVLLEEAEVQP
jgi:hypothetical protein